MRTRGLIRAATPEPLHDLWPRLRACLHDDDELIRLRVPPLGWREAVALGMVLGTLVLVPDPVHFLTACGLL
jgi:hypothetical protein